MSIIKTNFKITNPIYMSEPTQGTPKMAAAGGARTVDVSKIINPEQQVTVIPEDAVIPAGEAPKETVAVNPKAAQSVDDSSNPNRVTNPERDAATEVGDLKAPPQPVELTDDELKALYEQRFKPQVEATPEQIAEREKAIEKRMLDLYTATGGRGEDFYTLKQIVETDLTELSKSELTKELTEKGFTPDQIKAIQIERYYQLNPEEAERLYDETDEEFEARKEVIKKKVEYGTERLNNRSAPTKNNAQKVLDTLREAITAKDLQVQREKEFIAKVDDISSKLPSKITVELGKLNNDDLGSVETEVPQAFKDEIAAVLKDPEQRNKLLFNDDGELNIEGISNLLLRNKVLEAAARESLFEGQTRQTAIFQKTFPIRDAHSIGVGGATRSPLIVGGQKGKTASVGKPRVVNQPFIQR